MVSFAAIPVLVAPDTTVLTTPLSADGLPDYASDSLRLAGRDAAATGNGATAFWKAVAAVGLVSDEHRPVLDEIRLNQTVLPTRPETEPNVRGIMDWGSPAQRALASRPPAQQSIHRLRAWLSSRDEAMRLLGQASKAGAFYSPSPTLLVRPPAPLADALLPSVEVARKLLPTLAFRAMSAVGDNRLRAAELDLIALDLLGRHLTQTASSIGVLDGLRYTSMACRARLAIVDRVEDTRVLKKYAARSRRRGDSDTGAAVRFCRLEHLMAVDAITRDFSDRPPSEALADLGRRENRAEFRAYWKRGLLDPNALLRTMNEQYRELTRIAASQELPSRRDELRAFGVRLSQIDSGRLREAAIADGAGVAEANGVALGPVFATMFLPDAGYAMAAEGELVALQRMLHLVSLARIHQLTRNEYPESLEGLSDADMPRDPFSGKPFCYERRGEGFVLWSVGQNGVDDGANDSDGEFVDGEYAPVDWLGEREKPRGVDDLIIRLPIPELTLPLPAAETKN